MWSNRGSATPWIFLLVMVLFVLWGHRRGALPNPVPRTLAPVEQAKPLSAEPLMVVYSFPSRDPTLPPVKFEFRENKNEKVMQLSEILFFVRYTWKNEHDYVLDHYDCKHFAYQLYLDAQKANLSVRFVTMTIKGSPVGHALNAFKTSDHGILFLDFTPKNTGEGRSIAQKNVVYVSSGEPYVRMPGDYLPAQFENRKKDFFEQRNKTADLMAGLKSLQSARAILNQKNEARRAEYTKIMAMPDGPERNELGTAFNQTVQEFNDEIKKMDIESERLDRAIKNAQSEQWDLPADEWVAEQVSFLPNPF